MLRCMVCYHVFVSSLRFGSGLYDEVGFLGGSHGGGGGVGILTLYPAGGPYLCVWVFFLWRWSCVSSPPAGGGVGSYCASFGVTAQQSSWGTCGFLLCVMQLATLLGFHTSLTPVGWPPPAVEASRGVGGVWLRGSCYPTLVFYLVPAQLPLPLLSLRGSAPLPGASACLTSVCWSVPGVVLAGSLLCRLVFLLCAVLFLRACSVHCFP